MNPSTRIILNTLATYARSVFAIGLTLFSGRWVYNSLGQTDFGLYSVVGSIIVFIVFLNNIMSGSAGRFFAFSSGQGDTSEVNKWFNAAMSLHVILAIALLLIGLPVGEYVVRHVLNIPPERVLTCVWVFRLSLISAFISMVAVPFNAMFTAKQNIVEIAGWGMLQTILTFILAYSIRHSPIDKLLFYSIGMVAIISINRIILIVRGGMKYIECNLVKALWFNFERSKKIFSFAVWSLFGGGGAMLRDEGTAILLNMFFGPNVNASYGIATQVSSQTNQLSSAMLGAFSPEITASEGRGDRERMLNLSNSASKFGTIMILLFGIPLLIEMDYILELWLHSPPQYSSTFCRLIIIAFIIDRLSTGTLLAVSAKGRIAAYQATVGSCLLLTLPIAWICLNLGLNPTSVGFAFIATMTMTSIARSVWASKLFNIPVFEWMRKIVMPCLITALTSSIFAELVHSLFLPSVIRLLLVSITSASLTILLTWFIVLNEREKAFSLSFAKKLQLKVTGK